MKLIIVYCAIYLTALKCISQVQSNVYYKPDEKAVKIYSSINFYNIKIEAFTNLSKKDLVKIEKTLLKSINRDSNFISPYGLLGNIKFINQEYFGSEGAIELYTKFIDKYTKYPLEFRSTGEGCPGDEEGIFPMGGGYGLFNCEKAIRNLRFKCLLQAYTVNKDVFNQKKNNGQVVSIEKLSNYISFCEEDLINAENVSNKDIFEFYCMKAEFEFNRGDYRSAALSYKFILDKIQPYNEYSDNYYDAYYSKDDLKRKRELYEQIYKLCLSISDNQSALSALLDFFKLPHTDEDFKSIDFQKKSREVIRLINLMETQYVNNYDICNINGIDVFCDNKNIPLSNYSSAVQFVQKYGKYAIFNKQHQGLWESFVLFPSTTHLGGSFRDEINMETPVGIYNFYLNYGKDLGMLWPKYKPIPYSFELVKKSQIGEDKIVADMAKCGCLTDRILHIDKEKVFVNSNKDSTLTGILSISTNWQMFMSMSLMYKNASGVQVTVSSKGETLLSQWKCSKLYEIEKLNYENQQALLRAQQLQQEQELRRLQLEQNNREAQLKILEEENRKKQKEIDAQNAKNQQIENQKQLESRRATTEFMRYIFQNSGINSSSSSGSSSNNQSNSKKCNWCPKYLSKITYDYVKNFNGECSLREYDYVSQRYCSRECAYNACRAE